MYFIDTHAHLTDEKFQEDRNEVIKRASDKGIKKIIEISCEVHHWEKSLNFAKTNENIFCAMGIHPQEAKFANEENLKLLESLCINEKKVVAIGETGLDYYYENSPRDMQKEVFIKHLYLANKIKKPLTIHCRDAYSDMIEILNSEENKLNPFKGVIHCFSGTKEEAVILTDKGFFIGIDGPATYKNSRMLIETIKILPIEKILLETDCPYLPPQPYRGKRNEPAYLTLTAEKISEIKNISLEKVAEITTKNAQELFNI